MRVLSVGTDRNLVDPEAAASARQEAYAERLGEIEVILFSKKDHQLAPRKSKAVTVVPTNSLSRLFYGLDAALIARKLQKPDVVTAQDPFETGLAALLIARMLRAPLHVQSHTDFTSPEYARHSLLNRVRALIASYVLRRAARVRVVMKKTSEDLKRAGIKAPVTELPIFVDVRKFASIRREAGKEISLLCVGRLEKEKCFELAIRALSSLRKSGIGATLTVVGDGSQKARLTDIAKLEGVEACVEFVGFQKDLAPYYASASVLLVTSRYEGYGLVIVEALAAGLPVLSTDVGAAKEAGAIIASETTFNEALREWVKGGPRTMRLKNYPYESLEDYVEKYCADLAAAARTNGDKPLLRIEFPKRIMR